jgi:hypothetical protein
MAGGGDPRDSATEIEPPVIALRGHGAVRVKRWGKSPPRKRQRKRHGKPRREQDRIGTPRRGKPRQAIPAVSVRVGCMRTAATPSQDEWPPRLRRKLQAIQNPAYRPAGNIDQRALGKAHRVYRRQSMADFLPSLATVFRNPQTAGRGPESQPVAGRIDGKAVAEDEVVGVLLRQARFL